MRSSKAVASFAALILGLFAPLIASASITLTGAGIPFVSSVTGAPISLNTVSAQWTSPTDLTPITQFVNGWTGDLTLSGISPTGSTASYNVGTQASPNLSFNVSDPCYDSTATLTTCSRQIYATSWLRQVSPSSTSPTELAAGGNASIALTYNDFIYASSTPGAATITSALYTGAAAGTTAVTNTSTRPYTKPIAAWNSPAGRRIDGTATVPVELFVAHGYGKNNAPVAAVKFTVCDTSCTHSVSHTISTPTLSTQILNTSCTATNGSNVLTACGSTAGFVAGMHLTVPGIPGTAKILSVDSATQMTLGVTTTCTPTTNGAETCSTTPAAGNAWADGAFAGSKITDANLGGTVNVVIPTGVGSTSGSSTTLTLASVSQGQFCGGMWLDWAGAPAAHAYITGTSCAVSGTVTLSSAQNIPGGTAITAHDPVGGNLNATSTTSVRISTSATTGTASSSTVTFQHVYQGTTGTVAVVSGAPVPVYHADFVAADFSTLTDGNIWFRAQVYPNLGDSTAVLDTQTGALGNGCDWFYPNVSGTGGLGVCDSGSPAFFNVNGTKVSPSLQNLWAYLDAGSNYQPVYAWVSGTAGGSPAVSTSAADPGSTAYFATSATAVAALKTYYNTHGTVHHNDANGGVICLLAAGSPYAGFGGEIDTSVTVGKPMLTHTSATSGGSCPAPLAAGGDRSVIFTTTGTANNRLVQNMAFNNLLISTNSQTFQAGDVTPNTAFQAAFLQFNYDSVNITASQPALFRVGGWQLFNSYVNQSTNDGGFLNAGFPITVSGNTLLCGTFSTVTSAWKVAQGMGDAGWSCAPTNGPATSVVMEFSKLQAIGAGTPIVFGGTGSSINNIAFGNNLIEDVNSTGTQPGLQISADNVNVPMSNVVRTYNTLPHDRLNIQYLEGVPVTSGISVSSTGGSLAAGTYYTQATYSLKSSPTVETSTDGVSGPFTIATSTGAWGFSGSSLLPCDPNYVVNLYIDTVNPPAHYGQIGGVDAKALTMCVGTVQQSAVVTAVGSAHTPITVAGSTGHNELKTALIQRFNIDEQYNMKNDTYGAAPATASGGRVGNWEGRWNVANIGNVSVGGTAISSGLGPGSGQGEVACWLCYNPLTNPTDYGVVTYKSNRGFNAAATPAYPSLNIGGGDYCPTNTSTLASGAVPSGYAAYPFDLALTTRKNDGTGWAGAYEFGCQ